MKVRVGEVNGRACGPPSVDMAKYKRIMRGLAAQADENVTGEMLAILNDLCHPGGIGDAVMADARKKEAR